MDGFSIDDRGVGPEEPTYVIAEAGSNHNGDFQVAKALVDVAADAGADAIKFQTFRADKMYPEDGELYLRESDQTAHELFESLEMPYDWIPKLHDYATSLDLHFLSTPFDVRSARELEKYVPAYKVASSLSTHHPLLTELAKTGKPIILSTGAKELSAIAETVEHLRRQGAMAFALLQCTVSYPTSLDRANLRVIRTLADEFDAPAGLSDHTTSNDIIPAAAVALGASVIEKHITLDRAMEGPDHDFSLEPDQFDMFVDTIRNCEIALGSGEKRILDIEREARTGEPCLHAVEQIPAGDKLTDENTAYLRPLDDECVIDPSSAQEVLGRGVLETIDKGKKIEWDMLE